MMSLPIIIFIRLKKVGLSAVAFFEKKSKKSFNKASIPNAPHQKNSNNRLMMCNITKILSQKLYQTHFINTIRKFVSNHPIHPFKLI